MDYEKIVKQMIADEAISKEVAAKYFPELKESEDEKTKRAIYNALKYLERELSWDFLGDVDILDAYAWLEKQGTPAKLSEEEQNRFAKGVLTSCAMSFIDYLDAHKYEGKMCVSNGECEDIENAFHNAMWDRLHRYYCKYIEKQGEQKPTEWTAEDEEELKIALNTLEEAGQYSSAKWLKNVCLVPQTMQKSWSEEDKQYFNFLEKLLNNLQVKSTENEIKKRTNSNSEYYFKVIQWLKSLKDRFTWKPQPVPTTSTYRRTSRACV